MFSGVSSGLILCGLLLTMTVVGVCLPRIILLGLVSVGAAHSADQTPLGPSVIKIICQMTLNT